MSVTITTSRTVSLQKGSVLREAIEKITSSYHRDLDASSTKTVLSTVEVGIVLDYIAAERLRCMPHSGSRYDKVLRWAELFVLHVAAFAQNVSDSVASSQEATQRIWGSALLLLQLGETHLVLLEKLFGVYFKLGLALDTFTAHSHLLVEGTSAQTSCARAYAALLQVTANSTLYYHKRALSTVVKMKSGEFEKMFGRLIEHFYDARDQGSNQMWTISVESLKSDAHYHQTAVVRRFLAPQDSVVQALMSNRVSSRHVRAEYTCEWANKRISDFARGKNGLMIISGKEYSGKSVLAGWIAERISSSRGRIGHDVITYDLDPALKEQVSPLSVIKGLALQAFDRLIGDVAFYRALCAVIRADTEGKRPHELAELLWVALDRALSRMDQTMIIVDGIEILGEQEQYSILHRLAELSAKHTNLKAIVVTRPLLQAAPKNSRLFSIETDDVAKDIEQFALERLSTFASLQSLPDSQLQDIAERVANASNGSFAWADVAIEVLVREKTLSNISKILDSLPKNLKELINRLVATVDLADKDTRAILAWMMASVRPLLLDEVKDLLSIDCSALQIMERFSDAETDVKRACGGLISISDGILRFRSLAIRQHLLDLAAGVKDFSNSSKNAFPFHIAEASYDLCLRSLAYVKLVLDRTYPVAVEFLTYEQLIEVFSEHSFLQYSSRYWPTHFRNSPMHQYPKEHKLTGTFKNVLPDSVSHARIEGACLRAQYDLHESCDLLLLCVKLRRMVFGDEVQSVLQTTINLAMTRQRLLHQDYNSYYYEAFKLSKKLLSESSEVTLIVAQRYIDSVKTFTKSTEIEETLSFIAQTQLKQYGVSHSTTLTYKSRLAEYYASIKETTKAAALYTEVYDVLVSKYGYHHEQVQSVYKSLSTVATTEQLAKIQKTEHSSVVKSHGVSDSNYIASTTQVVEQYEKEKNVEKADEVMVNYWRDVTEKARTTKDVKVAQQQVDVTLQYVQFLQRQNRSDEATSILNGLYQELEHNTSYSEKKISWINTIATQLKSMQTASATSTARSIYGYLWKYYKNSGQQTSTEAMSVARSLTEVATSSKSTTAEVSTEEQIDIYKEILETSSLTSQTVDETTVNTTQRLISVYKQREDHDEIIEVSRDILQRQWGSVLRGSSDTKMTSTFSSQSVEIAKQLVQSYMKLSYVEEASTVMYGLYSAYRSQAKQHTEQFTSFSREIISHYQSIHRHQEVLSIYQSTYETLLSVYGATHQQTVNILYEKAAYELKQNRRKQALQSYEILWTSLKDTKTQTTTKEGIQAGLEICKIYEREQNWEAARSTYHTLWQTFVLKGQEYQLGVDYVEKVFDRYLYILEKKTSVDYETRRKLASEYHSTCIKFYGQDSERTLSSKLKLAQLNEKDEKFRSEAVSLYESILTSKTSSSASMFSVVTTARRSLARLYSQLNVTNERAQNLYIEEFEYTRSQKSVSHVDALFWLRLLITCYRQRNTAEDNKTASTRIQNVATELILQESDTQKLYEASKSIAKIYKEQNITQPTASEFLFQLRQHAITGESNIVSLKGKTLTRKAFTFIVGFEEAITGGQFSVIMSELMTEQVLVTNFIKQKKEKASFDTILATGNRLRSFLKNKGRSDYTDVEKELFELFLVGIVGQNAELDRSAARQFFDIVLNEFEKDSHDLNVLKITLEAMTRAFSENQFQRGYSLAYIAEQYLHHFDGFRSQSKIEIAIQICLRLAGRGSRRSGDEKIEQKMAALSGSLLTEVLAAAKAIRLSLISMPLKDLNVLVGILGQNKNHYQDLEWILNDLWNVRHSHTSWPATTVVAIGRRLVEVRFAMGERSSALHLLEDICYNLRRVWGPLDKTTLEMENLRAQMYTSLGQHSRAMAVHEDILAHLTSDELDLDLVTDKEEAEISVKHLQQLRLTFLRNGGKWPKDKDQSVYDDLYHVVAEQVKNQELWKTAKVEDVNKWGGAVKTFKDDGSGVWKGVPGGQWEFMADDSKVKHVNAMKRRSTRYSGNYGAASNGSSSKTNGSTKTFESTIHIQGGRTVQVNGS